MRVLIRPVEPSDESDFIAAALRSRRLHHPWTTAASTVAEFRSYCERHSGPANCALLSIHRESGALAGVFNISNIIRGTFRSAYLGYSAFSGFERQGLMREALPLVVRHAFKTLHLHRLEANIQPGNAPSIALVKACGFALEGYSPRYLKIGGRWRDHERWAIVATAKPRSSR